MCNVLLALLVLTLGCGIVSGPFPQSPTPTPQEQTCSSLDTQKIGWDTVAIFGGAVSGASGAALPIASEYADPDDLADWNLGLGLTSVVGAGLTVLGTSMSGLVVQEWSTMGCGGTP